MNRMNTTPVVRPEQPAHADAMAALSLPSRSGDSLHAPQRSELERMMKAMQEPGPEEPSCAAAEPQPVVVAAEESAAPAIDEPAEQAEPDSHPLTDLGEINARLAPISISADGLAQLGFTPDPAAKTAKLYRAADLPLILAAMVKHINGVGVDLLQAA